MIDNLTWRLVDLTPNDGMAPSATFFPDYDRYTSVVVVDSAVQYGFNQEVDPVPLPSLAAEGGQADSALAQVRPSSIKTSAVIEGGLPAVWTSIPGQDFFYSRSAYIAGQGSLANGISIKLGANTGLVIEGKASVQSTVDLSTVVGSSYFTDRPYAQVTLNGKASITADLHRQGGDIAGVTGSQWRMDADVTDSIDKYQLSSFVANPKSQANAGDFQLTFFNATGNDAQGVLKLDVFSQISASGVPEPDTLVLQGMGLAALGWLGSRGVNRRRKG
ncbi:MAG: PEP-CTERM sorting domain-containing protein [Aquabacterium sp.]